MTLTFPKRAILTFAAFATAAAVAACDNDGVTEPTVTPAAIAPATPTSGSAVAAGTIAGPAVTVTDASGAPAAGVIVKFQVTAGGGAIQYPRVATDAQGVASSGTWQLGPTVGMNTVTATVDGLPAVAFNVTTVAGPPTQVTIIGGAGQRADSTTTLPVPLTVRISDIGGNPAPNQTVTFTVTSGGGSIAGGTATTDASGVATSGLWTLGPTVGFQTVTAQAGAVQRPITARATGKCDQRTAIAVGGTAVGTLASGDCVLAGAFADNYALTTTNGQAVNITLTSAGFDPLVNAGININDAVAITPIATNAGTSATGAQFRLISAATTKTVTATSTTAGAVGAYTVGVASTSADVSSCGTVFLEVSASTAQTIATTDCDAAGYAADEFLVYIPAGATVRVAQQSPIDAYLFVFSPTGAKLAEEDRGFLNFTESATITAAVAGFYTVRASSWGLVNDDVSPAFDLGPYTLSVTAVSGFGQRSPTDLPTIGAAARQVEQLSRSSRTDSPVRGTTRDKK
jgi:hypothetical protein